MSEQNDTGTSTAAAYADGIAYLKFGEAAVAGFQVLPDMLLKSQGDLKISNAEMVVLLNILMHWWTPGQNPYPRPSTIAKRMGASTRTTQRAINSLEGKNILKRETDKGRVYLDPAPLVAKLNELVRSDTHYQYRKQQKQDTSKTDSSISDPF